MLCTSCGKQNAKDMKFCGSCGAATDGGREEPEAAKSTPVSWVSEIWLSFTKSPINKKLFVVAGAVLILILAGFYLNGGGNENENLTGVWVGQTVERVTYRFPGRSAFSVNMSANVTVEFQGDRVSISAYRPYDGASRWHDGVFAVWEDGLVEVLWGDGEIGVYDIDVVHNEFAPDMLRAVSVRGLSGTTTRLATTDWLSLQ